VEARERHWRETREEFNAALPVYKEKWTDEPRHVGAQARFAGLTGKAVELKITHPDINVFDRVNFQSRQDLVRWLEDTLKVLVDEGDASDQAYAELREWKFGLGESAVAAAVERVVAEPEPPTSSAPESTCSAWGWLWRVAIVTGCVLTVGLLGVFSVCVW